KRLEYFGMSGERLRVLRYFDYRRGALGVRPMRIEVENTTGTGGKSTMVFSDLRRIDASAISFTPDGIAGLRDAAVAARRGEETIVRLEALLAALAAPKS